MISSYTIDLDTKLNFIIENAIENKIILDAIKPQNIKQYSNIWKTRELLSEAQKLNGRAINHDISIPINKIPIFFKKAKIMLKKFYPNNILAFGHLAEGNLHYNISKPRALDYKTFKKLHKQINHNIFDLVNDLGGSFSAEHGIGTIKKREFKKYTCAEEYKIKKNFKKILDPNNIMNPGKIFN